MEDPIKKVFDPAKINAIRVRTLKGLEWINVRFPSDQEWIERQQKRKLITVNLGRGLSETRVSDSDEIDADLLARIRVDDGQVEVDGFEATTVFNRLYWSEILGDPTFDAGQFRVMLRILGNIETLHILRMPTAREEHQYLKSFVRNLDTQGSKQQTIINLPAAADLYSKLVISNEGYAGAVPIVHQSMVIPCVMNATKIMLGGDDVENF
jgi:hypothetical protein